MYVVVVVASSIAKPRVRFELSWSNADSTGMPAATGTTARFKKQMRRYSHGSDASTAAASL